ncbi:FAD dependent oxidoreductase superfamily [Fusarium albosuccineum]|uniref:FAD dependent oxidoreductase superfamily n=1 Tax=Fusarium albosuccineum TaxID=1237068 RepID=A0A8H4LLW9_9HYPO|nr:FAD dependent oxidoreductase superfamily [Fusarium albosuccineum]
MASSRDGIYEPGVVDPGFPVSNPTASFWQSDPHPLANHQSVWPSDPVDAVVIGAGITGVNIARNLLLKRPDYKVVLIEARSLCSGATGRNGGHIKTIAYANWEHFKKTYGVDEAKRLTEFEHSHLPAMSQVAKENGIDCDLVMKEGIDGSYDTATWEQSLAGLEDMRKHLPHLAAQYKVHTDKDYLHNVLKLSKRCIGAISVPGSTIWPYKFVTGLVSPLVLKGSLKLQTNTVVRNVEDADGNELAVAHTDRGVIRAKHIVHATNAWIGHLIHELRPFVSPVRGNVVHFTPTKPPGTPCQESSAFGFDSGYSYWLRYGKKDYDYLAQREGGDMVIGRANVGRRATSDDSETDLIPNAHLRGLANEVSLSPSPLASNSIDKAWSGILAFTEDGAPFIGRVPTSGHAHQWVCGGYHGYGMTKAFRAAEMVALLILGEKVLDEYPRSMYVTEERLRSLARNSLYVDARNKL